MSQCRYDCSEYRVDVHEPLNPDITGIGVSELMRHDLGDRLLSPGQVLVGYTASAGLVVLIITSYYFVAHQPGLNPFRDDEGNTVENDQFKPNPVDEVVLGFCRRSARLVVRVLFEAFHIKTAFPSTKDTRLERALFKVKQPVLGHTK